MHNKNNISIDKLRKWNNNYKNYTSKDKYYIFKVINL
jgi:hypothetical protein